jgi:predicted helicase
MKLQFKNIFISNINSWSELERKIETLDTTKKRGDAFEEFVYLFFLLNKNYYQIENVYMHPIPNPIKDKLGIKRYDAGVDGVIERLDGRLAAYQAKFRTGRVKPGYGELAKLWAEARNASMTYIVANCSAVTGLADQQVENHNILVDKFDALPASFFEELRGLIQESFAEHLYFSPDPHQKKIIMDVLEGFVESDRGKVISACGTGKTLTSLWIAEELKAKKILFVAPSLALIKQALTEWSDQIRSPLRYLCVCSDKTVASEVESRFTDDYGDLALEDIDFNVSTDFVEIKEFLETKVPDGVVSVLFGTYQSLEVVGRSVKNIEDFGFDFSVFDEAHRTAGLKISAMFSYGLSDENIKVSKRLFMTATEKLILPRTIDKIERENEDVELFSMDDVAKYGNVFSRLNFGDAIKQNIISDYEIVIAAAKSSEIFEVIKCNPKFISEELTPHNLLTRAQSVFKQILITKCFYQLNVSKSISFHSTVNQAKAFIFGSGSGDYEINGFFQALVPDFKSDCYYFNHVNGTMSAGARRLILDEFERYPHSLVSNAQCLTEGVNLPQVDCIYFVDSKHSMIDIIQACGRALRKSRSSKESKKAYFVVPVLIDDSVSEEDYINAQEFSTLHNIIQALRDEDSRLAEWVDDINLSHVSGKTVSCTSFGGKSKPNEKIKVLGYGLDLDFFSSKIALRIATINSSSHTKKYEKNKVYGKDDRKASVKRIFRTIADYGVEKFRDSLVNPTLDKLKSLDAKEGDIFETKNLKVNNNNISHCTRLGMFKQVSGSRGKYIVTSIAKYLMSGAISFEKLYKKQIIRYAIIGEHGVLFPYAACLYILHERSRLTFLEFVYALYSLQGSGLKEMSNSLAIIDYIRKNYPMIENLSQNNKKNVVKDLNLKFGFEYKVTDIWDKKQTTINNQFIYFKNNLNAFENLLKFESMQISLHRDNRKKVAEILDNNPYFNKDRTEVDLDEYYHFS